MSKRERIYVITVTWPHGNAKPLRLTYRDPEKALGAMGLHARNGVDAIEHGMMGTTIALEVLEVIDG